MKNIRLNENGIPVKELDCNVTLYLSAKHIWMFGDKEVEVPTVEEFEFIFKLLNEYKVKSKPTYEELEAKLAEQTIAHAQQTKVLLSNPEYLQNRLGYLTQYCCLENVVLMTS